MIDLPAGLSKAPFKDGRGVQRDGGRVLERARSSGAAGQPLEIQLIEFPSAEARDAYMADGRRTSLAGERDRAIARTQVIDVEVIQRGGLGAEDDLDPGRPAAGPG